jgi:hypothetical protein
MKLLVLALIMCGSWRSGRNVCEGTLNLSASASVGGL